MPTELSRYMRTAAAANRPRPRKNRHGYVLLMTLALLVIAALSEAGLARRSLQTALEAQQAQAALQRQWAQASCRQFLLERADALLIELEVSDDRRPQWPAPRELRAAFTLAGMDIELILADEDAKLNLNALYSRKPAELRAKLLDLLGASLATELRPDTSREAKLRKRWFTSWGQVVAVAQVMATPGGWEQLMKATADMTCWGEGKPNVRRASDRTIETVAAAVVGGAAARKLLEARRAYEGDLLLADLLTTLELRRADQLKLRGALSDHSSCTSLWMALGDGRRRWYHLWIQGDRGASGPDGLQSFHW
jgi:hypothetical protein